MKLIRFALIVAGSLITWRALHGRGRQVLQRGLHVARRDTDTTGWHGSAPSRGTHTSAAAAANQGFDDDRDVSVGDRFSAVGMRPGSF